MFYILWFVWKRWEGPYQDDNTASRLLSEVKHPRAWLVLRWGTTLESQVFFSFCFKIKLPKSCLLYISLCNLYSVLPYPLLFRYLATIIIFHLKLYFVLVRCSSPFDLKTQLHKNYLLSIITFNLSLFVVPTHLLVWFSCYYHIVFNVIFCHCHLIF